MKPEIVLGVTGTRKTPTNAQKDSMREIVDRYAKGSKLHQGCCTGTDAFMTMICGLRGWHITAHPPVVKTFFDSFSYMTSTVQLPEKEFLERNRDIVLDSTMLVAVPEGYEETVRSGTWATVRFARTMLRPRLIVWPDGRIEVDGE